MHKFTWIPDLGAQRQVEPTVNVTQFGDGYEVRSSSQLNVKKRTWTLTFTSNLKQIKPLLDFLDARQASESFAYTDPMGDDGVYVCRSWSSQQTNFGIYQVNATFEEVFEY